MHKALKCSESFVLREPQDFFVLSGYVPGILMFKQKTTAHRKKRHLKRWGSGSVEASVQPRELELQQPNG